jgi:hypothetical protein
VLPRGVRDRTAKIVGRGRRAGYAAAPGPETPTTGGEDRAPGTTGTGARAGEGRPPAHPEPDPEPPGDHFFLHEDTARGVALVEEHLGLS